MEGSLGCSGKIARYQYKRRRTVCATLGVRKRGDVCKKPNRTERMNQKLLEMGRGRKKRGNAVEAIGIKLGTDFGNI